MLLSFYGNTDWHRRPCRLRSCVLPSLPYRVRNIQAVTDTRSGLASGLFQVEVGKVIAGYGLFSGILL